MTRLMVLGILRSKSMSGYEIQQILQVSEADRWAGILPGSIYHALKKMEKEELVEVDKVEQTGHRIKAIYKITSKGEEEFQKLLLQSLKSSSVSLPSELYTGLSFIHSALKEDVLEALRAQKELLIKELRRHKEGIEVKRKYMEVDAITELTFENIYKQYDIQIELMDSLINIYEKK
ncbi:PadR family transcriptional regulator [Cytobacillus sp. FJAT-54145]|uniref:PadR family transcriptional regulator n=1 Tax=Cytobacillus spartinae TaxID=3299023 RepID=A0ABW6KH79_9BACI